MDVLRRIHTVRFKLEAFEAAFNDLRLTKLGLSVDDALELLYRFSIVGFTKMSAAATGGPQLPSDTDRQRVRPSGPELQCAPRPEGRAGAR